MKIAITTVQVPFTSGGAEHHASGLLKACRAAGHQADVISMPFRHAPVEQVFRAMEIWEQEDLRLLDGGEPDIVVCLKFPTYYLQHPCKVLWLLHQHRPVYDLWDHMEAGGHVWSERERDLRWAISDKDGYHIPRCLDVHTNSRNVSARLLHYNGIDAQPLYHPSPLDGRLHCAPAEPYIFCPSRLEPLKRQHLLVEAMQYVRSPVTAVISGEGSQAADLARQVAHLGLSGRVRFVGRLDEARLIDHYARCLAVFFGPFDEDYGYVTLEAMLAAKPVITCGDSGGPLEFITSGETGYVVPPEPRAVAAAIDELHTHPDHAAWMGEAGLELYRALGLSWDNVLLRLLC